VRVTSVLRKLLGLCASVVICGFELTEAGGGRPKLVVTLRRRFGTRGRCGRCGVVAPWFDNGGGPRTWRHVDIGLATVELLAAVKCDACKGWVEPAGTKTYICRCKSTAIATA
jgi:hypothetical protein